MKKVSSVIGNPKAAVASPAKDPGDIVVYQQHACPECSVRCNVFEDGSIYCIFHGSFEPEPRDGRLYEMRQSFLEQLASSGSGDVQAAYDHGSRQSA